MSVCVCLGRGGGDKFKFCGLDCSVSQLSIYILKSFISTGIETQCLH